MKHTAAPRQRSASATVKRTLNQSTLSVDDWSGEGQANEDAKRNEGTQHHGRKSSTHPKPRGLLDSSSHGTLTQSEYVYVHEPCFTCARQ
jgi:hypothetical protein